MFYIFIWIVIPWVHIYIKIHQPVHLNWKREKKYRGKKRAKTHSRDCTRKLLLKTIDRGKGEGYNTVIFLWTAECRFWGFRSLCHSQVRPCRDGWCSGAGVELSPGSGQPGDPQGHTGRTDSAAWSAFRRGYTASLQAKGTVGAIELHQPPIQEQTHQWGLQLPSNNSQFVSYS